MHMVRAMDSIHYHYYIVLFSGGKKGIFPDVHVVCSSVHAKDREARPPHEPGMHLAIHDALDFGYGKSTSRLRDSTHALRDVRA
jgi:hypothetical protein